MPLCQPPVRSRRGRYFLITTNIGEPKNPAGLEAIDVIPLQKCTRDSTSVGVVGIIPIDRANENCKSL